MSQLLKQLGHALGRKQTEARHQPSGLMNAMPTCSAGIESCIKDTAEIIRTVRTGLDKNTRESVIEGNSPFLIKSRPVTETSCQRVVLMIHGLTDSPFVTRDLAKTFSELGFDVLSILLPGHGTCPGDLLDVHWKDWTAAQADALNALAERYSELYLCGFSLGGALNLNQAATDRRIKGLFLFSPALQLTPAVNIACGLSKASDWLPHLQWIDIQPDDDAFKYESIAANAVCQTRHLVKCVRKLLALGMPEIPVFIAASEDDVTVQSAAAIPFFDQLPADHKRLLYFSKGKPVLPAKARLINSALPEQKIISASHMAMMAAPDNPHYGQHGSYAYCNHYYRTDAEKYRRCKARQEDCLGEIFIHTGSSLVVRRLTYNPWYNELKKELERFIENIYN